MCSVTHAIEERFVPVLEGHQENVTLDVGWFFPNVAENPVHLVVLGVNSRRKEAAQAKGIAFALRKRGTFVQARIMKNLHSARNSVLFHFQTKNTMEPTRIKIGRGTGSE